VYSEITYAAAGARSSEFTAGLPHKKHVATAARLDGLIAELSEARALAENPAHREALQARLYGTASLNHESRKQMFSDPTMWLAQADAEIERIISEAIHAELGEPLREIAELKLERVRKAIREVEAVETAWAERFGLVGPQPGGVLAALERSAFDLERQLSEPFRWTREMPSVAIRNACTA
jgi:hypothetical protein